ncbi:hypothetical protein R2APBS1_2699 [Rhodanobacter denitrificans]|uniref:Uncharacterized protein n=1 Tax=Rhodanobacter denitrificans TaxID=666685 RepID=M4NJA8_9GAMM|nr:hypothetical protein R2APBS1_2699 [Rhodanobacter denitrificans]
MLPWKTRSSPVKWKALSTPRRCAICWIVPAVAWSARKRSIVPCGNWRTRPNRPAHPWLTDAKGVTFCCALVVESTRAKSPGFLNPRRWHTPYAPCWVCKWLIVLRMPAKPAGDCIRTVLRSGGRAIYQCGSCGAECGRCVQTQSICVRQ